MATIEYNVRFKNLFFDTKRVKKAVDGYSFEAFKFFGFGVRETARKKLGKPNAKIKTRAPGKPPRVRTEKNTVTLRNVQFAYRKGKYTTRLTRKKGQESVNAGVVIFPGTKRYSGKSVPEVQEFGGRIRTGFTKVVERTKTGRVKRKNGRPADPKIIYGDQFKNKITVKIPKRPFLNPSLKPAVNKTKRRLKGVSI